ncbi:MAG: alpha/beta fold hydrolase [Hydrogenophaga sp.]|uniref:alpha/beta hydrolase-fold protein n=1 Tax=Hydrogenophaga sp. TaxID=1904254 RepID=UPI0026137A52|nr:alpha/beta hydrolase-fold protein [Hydrogenophaga sp.]MCV0441090.1 alpha/beta fold hydrolase [Hydrogenophaga sp.]
MTTVLRTVGTPGKAPHLLVMLPGMVMRPEELFEAGFADAIAQRGLPVDLLAVDVSGIGLDAADTWGALQDQILAPARAARSSVWLGGISLGGMVAMAHAAAHPGAVDGLCLLAPYPGSRPSVNVMERAGGPDHWQPTPDDLRDPELRVWQWLQCPPPDLPVFVGHGTEDRFAARIERVAGRFAPASRHTVAGGHDWPAWRLLWDRFLDAGHFTP